LSILQSFLKYREEGMMTKVSFSVTRTFGSFLKFLLFIGVLSINLYNSDVRANNRCPVGQFFRVSKKECEEKTPDLAFLTHTKKKAATSAVAHKQNHAKDTAPAMATATPAVDEAPVVDTDETPPTVPQATAAQQQPAASQQIQSSTPEPTGSSPYGALSYK
jgi:hypothetical protein